MQELRLPQCGPQRGEQFEHDTHAAQVFVRVRTRRLVWIQHRTGIGEPLWRLVMVGDDNVHAQATRQSHFLPRRTPTIDRNQQAYPRTGELSHGISIETIPFAGALWNVVRHLEAQLMKKRHQQRGGRDSVHIIIAVDGDAFALADGCYQALHRLLHPMQAIGIV